MLDAPVQPVRPVQEAPTLRLKRALLGPALPTARLIHERLGVLLGLAVLASDNISSSAYGTEQVMLPLLAAGLAGTALTFPIAVGIAALLAILILSYRQTIAAYPSAGGAYVVTKDNFGLNLAQVAGAALLIDYVLTVSVSVAAGIAAVVTGVPALTPYIVPLSVACIALITWGNLRGVRESGKMFGVPTYVYVASFGAVVLIGLARLATGHLAAVHPTQTGPLPRQTATIGLLLLMHAYASGCTALTGVEAISNGIPAFRRPEAVNARKALVMMGSILGILFLGFFEFFQFSTLLILVLAANTSFADFPRLASFAAGDAFMPRQFTRRGHRLVFSNGIFTLAAAATVLLVAFRANLNSLIPLYAIGVFISFTMSQAGMTRRHLRLREPGWRYGIVVNGLGAVVTFVVLLDVISTKFTHGAWMVLVALPVLVLLLYRTNRAYSGELAALKVELSETFAPPKPRHEVLVLVEALDRPSLLALQYANQLRPLRMSALHVAVDPDAARRLATLWAQTRVPLPLEIVDCPDRNLVACVRREIAERYRPDTELTVLVPRRGYASVWHRLLLHDRTSVGLIRTLGDMDNVNVTIVPFRVRSERQRAVPAG